MVDFGEDSRNNKVIPIIKSDRIEEIKGVNAVLFNDVDRYRNKTSFVDFEIITSVDYSGVLQDEHLKNIAGHLVENKNQYNERELAYLLLRHLISHSWKLDICFFLHLNQCLYAKKIWGNYLRTIAFEEGILNGQPYWLRNEMIALHADKDSEIYSILPKIELIMVKSKKIFPKCSSLGDENKAHYFIHIDSGIYTYLFEWVQLLLSGYRINQYNIYNQLFRISEPIQTGALLMLAVAKIIHGDADAFALPETVFTFSNYDYNIIKEITNTQIGFLIRHECAHIYAAEKKIHMDDKEEELYADNLAFKILEKQQMQVVTLNDNGNHNVNDIQSVLDVDRILEDIELLFLFYDMYFYASDILGYEVDSDDSHPHSIERRKKLKERYLNEEQGSLLNYAENISTRIMEEMKKYERN